MTPFVTHRAVSRRLIVGGTVASFFAAPRSEAADPKEHLNSTVLTISGKIKRPGGTASFTLADLKELGLHSFSTSSPWNRAPARFEGVLMSRLMTAVGAHGSTITAFALNDYISQIPVEDFERHGVLLAMKRDGEYMPVSNKGPLFIIYPYDSNPTLRSRVYYSRSPWSVFRIEVS